MKMAEAIQQDGGKIGDNTIIATGDVVGGWAGAWEEQSSEEKLEQLLAL